MSTRFLRLLALQLTLLSCWSLTFAKTWRRQARAFRVLRGGASSNQDEGSDDFPQLVPSIDVPPKWATTKKKRAIIFMDKFTPYFGYYLSQHCREAYGVAAINVFSNYMKGYFLKEHPGLEEPLSMCMPMNQQQVEQWKSQIYQQVDEIVGIICESDSGLAGAERLGVALQLENHDGFNEARRNKYLMVEQVGKAGLAVVKQKLCSTPEEAVDFARELGVAETEEDSSSTRDDNDKSETSQQTSVATNEQDINIHNDDDIHANTGSLGNATNVHHHDASDDCHMCIVKPIRGAATDSVFLCKSQNDVKKAFGLIYGMPVFDTPKLLHDSVLVQEFASGTEYALDIVSKNGHHKVAALWRYDKRPANGASFVYHATEVVDADTRVGRIICDYAKQALDALGIRWGQSHTEVILSTKGQPRLVEVNCRQHNMDFAPLTMACIGYNSLDMLLAAYLGGNEEDTYPPDTADMRLDWDTLPDLATTRAFGAVVHLINFADGILLSVNEDALHEIQEMESVFAMEIYPSFLEVGSPILPTIDIRTDAGWVQIINDDKQVFQRDYERIVELMPTLFVVDESSR